MRGWPKHGVYTTVHNRTLKRRVFFLFLPVNGLLFGFLSSGETSQLIFCRCCSLWRSIQSTATPLWDSEVCMACGWAVHQQLLVGRLHGFIELPSYPPVDKAEQVQRGWWRTSNRPSLTTQLRARMHLITRLEYITLDYTTSHCITLLYITHFMPYHTISYHIIPCHTYVRALHISTRPYIHIRIYAYTRTHT